MALERITFRRCVLRRRGYSRDAMARGRRRSRQANRGTERGTRATVAKESAALSPDREPYVPTLDSLEEISGWWLGTFRERLRQTRNDERAGVTVTVERLEARYQVRRAELS